MAARLGERLSKAIFLKTPVVRAASLHIFQRSCKKASSSTPSAETLVRATMSGRCREADIARSCAADAMASMWVKPGRSPNSCKPDPNEIGKA
jgi:hypothetical protein